VALQDPEVLQPNIKGVGHFQYKRHKNLRIKIEKGQENISKEDLREYMRMSKLFKIETKMVRDTIEKVKGLSYSEIVESALIYDLPSQALGTLDEINLRVDEEFKSMGTEEKLKLSNMV
jgi:hypothetical protein